MVLDLTFLLNPEDKAKLHESQKRRFQKSDIIEECEELYRKWKESRGNADTLRMHYSANNKKIAERKKESKGKDPCEELVKENKDLDAKIVEAEKHVTDLWENLMKRYHNIGNIVHDSVPISDDEANNRVERTWGEPNKIKIDGKPGTAHHNQILTWIGGYDPERGSNLSGHRGYFLKGAGFLLNQALIMYGTQFLMKYKYTPIQPPFFMKQEVMHETCELTDFEENLYK